VALVHDELFRRCERDHGDERCSPVELLSLTLHLDEVLLASQSSQMPEEDEQQELPSMFYERGVPAFQIEESKGVDGDPLLGHP